MDVKALTQPIDLQEMKTETDEINNKKKSHAYISYTK
jgi:hypothetical protein